MNHSRSLLTLFCLALWAWQDCPVQGQVSGSAPWRTAKVSFVASQRPVRELLKEFAASQSMPLSLSEPVKGVVSGTFEGVATEAFLNAICIANDLTWFYDGVRLIIETTDEVLSRALSLPSVTPETLNGVLFSVGYASGPPGREAAARAGHRPGLILLVGGPQFIQATEALARDLDEQESRRSSEQVTVRTFRLNYASASDITLNTGSSSTVVPGVANSLQQLMSNQVPGASMSTGPVQTQLPRSRPGLRGTGLASYEAPSAPRSNPLVPNRQQGATAQSGPQDRFEPPDPNDPRQPMIVVDSRLNAVLVRDVEARMPLYEELIRMLDVPTKAIEITAAIVDIDTQKGRQIGLELLGFRNNGTELFRGGFNADRGIFDGVDIEGQTPSFTEGSNLARGAGLNVTALIGGAGYELLTRLRAIEQVGAGQIVSSPSVLTMENVQAVIRTDEKVYVRVEGNMEVDLFDVTTGVQLRVTPTLVRETGSESFRLQIDIVDGSFTDQSVDDIPATRESAINTQAVVPESKTLLLGGYFVERRASNATQVPFISKIPLVGKLFSRTEKTHNRTQRFFFITPRLVDVGTEATDPADYYELEANKLAIPSNIPREFTSRQISEDLARRLATQIMDAAPATKNNPLVPVPAVLPPAESRIIPLDGPLPHSVPSAKAPSSMN